MLRFESRGERASSSPAFEAAPLDIDDPEFVTIARANDIRRDVPASVGSTLPSHRIHDLYLNDPELQRIYPLGLLPLGQRDFVVWLTTHGRRDQGLTDAEIMQFLRQTAEDQLRGWRLIYLLQPAWQAAFPSAFNREGWNRFAEWINTSYRNHLSEPLPMSLPAELAQSAVASSPGVNILSHFCNPSGIQQAAVWTKSALERAGLLTSCRDVPVPRRSVARDREQWLGLEVFPITILTHAATPYFENGYDRAGLAAREDVYRIAYWAWELETVPDEWVKAAELVDEVWAPTEFVAQAMRARLPRPVFRMLPGVEAKPVETVTRSELQVPEDHFVFLFMFDLHSQAHRKNPVGVFRAFVDAFRDDDKATLLIKCTGGDIHAADLAALRATIQGKNVILFDRLMSRPQAYGLIAMADCFVSLHRSEGFGLPLAEAMLLGKPVIATGYSGNLDFMTRENSLLVDYEMTEIQEDRPIYTRGNFWAEPSLSHASALMREVYERPDEARARALCAQPETKSLLSLEAAGKRMRARLAQIIGSSERIG